MLRYRRTLAGAPQPVVEVTINFTGDDVEDAVSDGAVLGGTALPGSEPTPGTLGPDEARIVAVG